MSASSYRVCARRGKSTSCMLPAKCYQGTSSHVTVTRLILNRDQNVIKGFLSLETWKEINFFKSHILKITKLWIKWKRSFLFGTNPYLGPRPGFPGCFPWTRCQRFAYILFDRPIASQAIGVVQGHLFVIGKRTDTDDRPFPDSGAFPAADRTVLPRPHPPPNQLSQLHSVGKRKGHMDQYLGGQDCLLQTWDFSRGFSSAAQ